MTKTLFKWFTDILLKANPEKSHLLAISAQEIKINMGAMAISNSKCEKLLGIHIDNKLTNQKLNNHINRIHERNLRTVYIKTIIHRLMNLLQKKVPSKFMTVVCKNYLLKYLK